MSKHGMYDFEESRDEFAKEQERGMAHKSQRKLAHRREANVLFLIAVICIAGGAIFYWFRGETYDTFFIAPVVAVVWGLLKMAISFLPHGTPYDRPKS